MSLLEEAKKTIARADKASRKEDAFLFAASIAADCAYHTLALQLADQVELATDIIHSLEKDMDTTGLANIIANATEAMERLENMERN